MSGTAGRIRAESVRSPRRHRRPNRSAATAKVIAATRFTTDVITFAAIVITIIVLTAGMVVAPFAIAWYTPDFSWISDNLRTR